MTTYLDHSATTPIDPEAAAILSRALLEFPGNPSSIHESGRRARAALETARKDLAGVLGVRPSEFVFTASGSEGNNLAIKGILLARAGRPSHIVVSAIEHVSVLHAARAMAMRFPWVELTEVAPEPGGAVRPETMIAAFRPETCLVCLMHANNETGRIQPVAQVARAAKSIGALFHCDAVQSLGRIPLDPAALGCDTLAIAAHKFYGPKGFGALVVRKGTAIDPLIHGGTQEGIMRAGTENLPAALAMAFAAKTALASLAETREKLNRLESAFLAELRRGQPELEINGAPDDKVPGVVNLSIPGVEQDDLVVGMDLSGFAISAGSACSSGVIEPSHVLTAMGIARWRIDGGIRVSFGRENTMEEALAAARALASLSLKLQQAVPLKEAL